MSSLDAAINRALLKFLPPEKISLADWAEKKIYLSPALSSVAPGKLKLDFSPHLKYVLNAVDNNRYKKITWISSVQSGKTLFEMILAAYFMAEDPSNILLFEPNEALARGIAIERFNPLIEANPFLKQLFVGSSTKNNDVEKIFPGGYLNFGSAGSLNDLISRSARIVLLDEVDSYNLDLKNRGNPIQLARDRTVQQPRSKFIMVGTPATETSELFHNYEKSNKAVLEYACIYCGGFQELKFGGPDTKYGIKWEPGSEGEGAWYQCVHCGKKMYDSDKFKLFQHSQLKVNAPKPVEKDHFGLWTNGLYSMSSELTWEKIAQEHISAKRRKDRADRKRFTNSILAEMFIENKFKIEEDWLMRRAIEYPAEVPIKVGMLYAGIDVQGKDWIEITVLGFAKNDQIYIIDRHKIFGDTHADPTSQNTVWSELDTYLDRPFKHESGREIYIQKAFLDVADGTNPTGRNYCLLKADRGIYACMGSRHVKEFDGYFGSSYKDHITGSTIIPLNSNMLKDEVYDRLTIGEKDACRYVSFPKFLDESYYKGLLSERRIEEIKAGITKVKYKTVHDRNEPLDTFCYAFACFKWDMGRRQARFEETCDLMMQPLESESQAEREEAGTSQAPAFDFFAAKKRIGRF